MRDSIIQYLVYNFPTGITRVRLMKLLYLIDVEAEKRIGKHVIVNDWFESDRDIPFSETVGSSIDKLVKSMKIHVEPGADVSYRIIEPPPKLPDDIRGIVDYVVKTFGYIPIKELVKTVEGEHDWKKRLIELAEKSSESNEVLAELIGRIHDEYREELEFLPRNTLILYGFTVSSDSQKTRELTEKLVNLLEEIRTLKPDKNKPLPTELLEKIRTIYNEILNTATSYISRR